MTVGTNTILLGDVRDVLPTLPDRSVQMCVTSPPYWGLRDYGTATWEGGDARCDHKPGSTNRGDREELPNPPAGWAKRSEHEVYGETCRKCGAKRIDSQLGLEPTPEEFVTNMTAVFREVRRVLRDDGVIFVNMGDSYWNGGGEKRDGGHGFVDGGKQKLEAAQGALLQKKSQTGLGLKPKDLVGMPWRLAFALQADGWYLRQDIIWSKPSPMPESVTDRCTKAHEYIFLLSKNGGKALLWRAVDTGEWSYAPDLSERITQASGAVAPRWRGFDYYFDAEAIREDAVYGRRDWGGSDQHAAYMRSKENLAKRGEPQTPENHTKGGDPSTGRNRRSVWTVASQAYSDAHFATFPERLIEPCILAGCPAGGIVLDPFFGSGTTGQVCERLGRQWLGVELNPDYVDMAKRRTAQHGLGI